MLVNGLDVGNLHIEDVAFVKENQERILGINDFTIGEHYDENDKVSYNAKVKMLIANKNLIKKSALLDWYSNRAESPTQGADDTI